MKIHKCEICDCDYVARTSKSKYCCSECKQIAMQLNQLRKRQRAKQKTNSVV